MTVPWNIGDRVVKVGEATIFVIEAFRREDLNTVAVVREQGTENRREIRIDVATPVLYRKVS